MNGILIIDKSGGMTSHDVVQSIRKKFDTSKVGHLGTLDPMATGVLPVTVGKATRIAQFLPSSPKEYEGEIRFGFATNTYDREGIRTTEERPLEGNVEEAVRCFTGWLDQVPPPFSAKKIGGVPSYKLARRDEAVEIAPSRVEVGRFDILALTPPLMTFRVVCSPGTYIRSLAHDLGQRLGCGAHLTSLRRSRSGDFRIQDAVSLQQVSARDIIPLDELLPSMPRIEVSAIDETKVNHGNAIACQAGVEADGQFARIFNKKGEFLAVASVENGLVRPRLVLTSITSDESGILRRNLEKRD
jgi:tRNA pseudouridine55 synthase